MWQHLVRFHLIWLFYCLHHCPNNWSNLIIFHYQSLNLHLLLKKYKDRLKKKRKKLSSKNHFLGTLLIPIGKYIKYQQTTEMPYQPFWDSDRNALTVFTFFQIIVYFPWSLSHVYGIRTNRHIYEQNWMHLLVIREKHIVKYKIQIFHDILLWQWIFLSN